MDDVAEVKSKTDIVSIIGEHVRLNKAGRNFKGLCPFHEERSPSFMVSPELQIYKCFGCGEAGDVFTFLEKYEGLEFYEALKFLADKVGVKLSPRAGQENSIKQKVLEANDMAARFYHYLLTSHKLGREGLEYLTTTRGISADTINSFNLGFAPPAPTLLFDTLTKKKGLDPAILESAGLVFKTRVGYMDRFRGRVIFPITNHRNEVVALAGRILPQFDDKKSGKYINSPESPVYHKSSSLYGLNLTKENIRDTKSVVVVEGELDLISTWQTGIKNIVAIKGTAMTVEHVRLISRFAEVVIMALDSDFAGDSAAIRGLSFAQNAGLEIKVVEIRDYKDPDEFARADAEGFKAAVKNAVDAWEFIINVVAKRYDLATGPGKARASRQIIPILATIDDDIVRAHYAQKTAYKLGVPVEAVMQEISKRQNPKTTVTEVKEPEKTQATRRDLLEEELLALLLSEPALLTIPENQNIFETPIASKIMLAVTKHLDSGEAFDAKAVAEKLPDELKSKFSEFVIGAQSEEVKNPDKQAKLLVRELTKITLKERMQSLARKMNRYESAGKSDKLSQIEEEFGQLSKKISELG